MENCFDCVHFIKASKTCLTTLNEISSKDRQTRCNKNAKSLMTYSRKKTIINLIYYVKFFVRSEKKTISRVVRWRFQIKLNYDSCKVFVYRTHEIIKPELLFALRLIPHSCMRVIAAKQWRHRVCMNAFFRLIAWLTPWAKNCAVPR